MFKIIAIKGSNREVIDTVNDFKVARSLQRQYQDALGGQLLICIQHTKRLIP